VGAIVGPLLGGVVLGLGFQARELFVVAAVPLFALTVLMTILGQLRRSRSWPER
jgi:MFS family permease